MGRFIQSPFVSSDLTAPIVSAGGFWTDDGAGSGTLNGSATSYGGKVWQSASAWTRSGGSIVSPSVSGQAFSASVTDATNLNGTLSATLAAHGGAGALGGLLVRGVDDNNFYCFYAEPGNSRWVLKKYVGSSFGDLGVTIAQAPVVGDVASVSVLGNQLSVAINGVTKGTVSDTSLSAAAGTRRGLMGYGGVTTSWRNISWGA